MKYGILETEQVLPDDYPIYYQYAYICDGVLTCQMDFTQGTVGQWKRERGFKEIRNYAMFQKGRDNAKYGDEIG